MSPENLGADTDLLNSPALEASRHHMRSVIDRFKSEASAAMPVVQHHRSSQLDSQLRQSVPIQVEIVTEMLESVHRLTQGDVSGVQDLSTILANAESDAIDVATADRRHTH
ncbi:hypothetical protein [Actinoplanes sp. HUAS TT8]|uniref:hypothetical protein n=1 Tax=Actinoplanes sp. HUAS TT8 TaxID=3447453 RepID=UPI003F52285D